MWVYEEVVNGRKLTSIINTIHENIKCVLHSKGSPGSAPRNLRNGDARATQP